MCGRIDGESEAHATYRRVPPALALLRLAAVDLVSATGRLRGQSQACPAAHAADGHGDDLPAAADERAASRTSHLPVFAAECGGVTGGPGVERGHHLRAAAPRLHVFGCNSGLAQPIRTGVAVVEHAGQRLLRGRPADGIASWSPEIFNTDQGSQFTSRAFTSVLEEQQIAISMDGRRRALDNVFIERLWWSVKYENVYVQGYETVAELERGLRCYFDFYGRCRPHQALDNRTPWEVYWTARQSRKKQTLRAKFWPVARLKLKNLLTLGNCLAA